VICWVHSYQWGDATDVRGYADTKRLGTPGLENVEKVVKAKSNFSSDQNLFFVQFYIYAISIIEKNQV